MAIASLNIFTDGTMTATTPMNQNFETLRVACNTNESAVSSVTSAVAGKADATSVYTKAETQAQISSQMGTEFSSLYPVGSLYLTTSTSSTCPLASVITGSTWTLVGQDRVLQGASSASGAGGTKSAGLPNINGSANYILPNNSGATPKASTSAFGWTGSSSNERTSKTTAAVNAYDLILNASNQSSIYGNSSTVQPPALLVNIWQRTA